MPLAMAEQNPRGRWALLAGIAALVAVALGAFFLLYKPAPPPAPAPADQTQIADDAEVSAPKGCTLNPGDGIGGAINLVDQSGEAITQEHFSEGPTLIYFGYTFCPDVCPLALQMEKKALAELGQEGGIIQPVFISLDPARDTPEQMAQYVSSDAFTPGLVGLTGSEAQVAAAAKAFRVFWQKEEAKDSAAKYLIGHSSYFYLMDEEWKPKAVFPSTFSPSDAAQCIKAALQTPGAPG